MKASVVKDRAAIFLTVGTQLPFDRLVRSVDAWAGADGRGQTVFGQIAEPGPGGHRPVNFNWIAHLDPASFEARFAAADLIVAHAGMGSIIGALAAPKPILILPRRAALGEQRNDHQLATARRFAGRPGVTVCMDEAELGPVLDRLLSAAAGSEGAAASTIGAEASPGLLGAIRAFVFGNASEAPFPPRE